MDAFRYNLTFGFHQQGQTQQRRKQANSNNNNKNNNRKDEEQLFCSFEINADNDRCRQPIGERV